MRADTRARATNVTSSGTKWAKLAAISEIVSSVAIVVTLIYLAIQSQQTNSALLATSRQATMTADVTMIASLISNPDAWANMSEPFADLTLAEQGQVRNMAAGLFRVREFAWFQYENGVLDEDTLRSYLAPMVRWLQMEGMLVVWNEFSTELDPEFVAYVNAERERPR